MCIRDRNHVFGGDAHWCSLANTIESSMYCGNVACCQSTLTTYYYFKDRCANSDLVYYCFVFDCAEPTCSTSDGAKRKRPQSDRFVADRLYSHCLKIWFLCNIKNAFNVIQFSVFLHIETFLDRGSSIRNIVFSECLSSVGL